MLHGWIRVGWYSHPIHSPAPTCNLPLFRGNVATARSAVGLLTRGLIDRTQYYVHALSLAMCPFLHPTHYGCAGASETGRLDGEAAMGKGETAAETDGKAASPVTES